LGWLPGLIGNPANNPNPNSVGQNATYQSDTKQTFTVGYTELQGIPVGYTTGSLTWTIEAISGAFLPLGS
jgi:hypothetical protein